jgi:hypothetical protein
MRELTKGEDLWMSNYMARGLEQLGLPITPRTVEREMARVETTLRAASSAGPVPPPPSLEAALRAAAKPTPTNPHAAARAATNAALADYWNAPRPLAPAKPVQRSAAAAKPKEVIDAPPSLVDAIQNGRSR